MKKVGWDVREFRKGLLSRMKAAMKDFPPIDEDDLQGISYYLPEGKSKLRELLLEDEEEFVQCLVAHVLKLADLAPTITKVLTAGPK